MRPRPEEIRRRKLVQTPQRITLSSTTFKDGDAVPQQYTPDGRNDSPPLAWGGVPADAKELAVPSTAKGLPEALPIDPAAKMPAEITGAVQGTSGFRRAIYRGPAPPAGKPHHYHFVVYALDTPIAVTPGQIPLTRAELLDAMKGHVIGQGELVATYERQ